MSKTDSEKRSRGKPSKFDPSFCERAIAMGRKGYSVVQMASAFGVARSTLIGWRTQHEDFDAAMDLAQTHAQAAWEKIGFESLHRKDFQGASYVKLMQARFRCDYTERAEISGPDGAALQQITKIELVGVKPKPREGDDTTNVIDISPNLPSEPEAMPEPNPTPDPAMNFVAPSNLEKPEPMRSAEELLALYDAGKADDLSDAEDDLLTRACVDRHKRRAQDAEQAEKVRKAKKVQQRLYLPRNIGARKRWTP